MNRLNRGVTCACLCLVSGTAYGQCVISAEELPVPLEPPSMYGRLHDVRVAAPNDIWAVGYSQDTTQWFGTYDHSTLTLRFDGAAWHRVPSPTPRADGNVDYGELAGVAITGADRAVAVGFYDPAVFGPGPGFQIYGDTLALGFDGSAWAHVPSPGVSTFGTQGYYFNDVHHSGGGEVWVVGFGASTNGVPDAATAARFDGTSWNNYAIPRLATVAGVHNATAVGGIGGEVWVAGQAGGNRGGGGVGRAWYARWNGSAWTSSEFPQRAGWEEQLFDLAVVASDDIWAVGSYRRASDNSLRPLRYHWDGSAWTLADSSDGVFAASITPVRSDDIWGVSANRIVHYDGSAWSVVHTIPHPPNGDVLSLHSIDRIDDDHFMAVGFIFHDAFLSSPVTYRITRTCPPQCPADFNNDGFVSGDDFDLYVAAFELGDPSADFNADGFVTGDDFDAFVLAFEGGC